MNKRLKIILNIAAVIASVVFIAAFIGMISSFSYRNSEDEDTTEIYLSVFEYELSHKAYGEILNHYYANRMDDMNPPEGLEVVYMTADYAHTAFMSRVYNEKGDTAKETQSIEKLQQIRSNLGDHSYITDEVDDIIRSAP